MGASSERKVTLGKLVEDQIKTVHPLFDEHSEYLFWGALIRALPGNGLDQIHKLSGIPKLTLIEYLKEFDAVAKPSNKN